METRDVFLCHASEDKAQVVEPLVAALTARGVSCWYDVAEIKWGDSITKKVNDGLATSHYVLVILSPHFMRKPFPQRELFATLNLEASTGEVRVLPLLCGDSAERRRILEALPLLNDKFYITWSGDPDVVVSALAERLSITQRADLKVPGVASSLELANESRDRAGVAVSTVGPSPVQNVSLYLLGEDYLRIGWLFVALGTGGVFAMPAIGVNVSVRALWCFAMMMVLAVCIGVFLSLTGKYYKEAGHKYPSLNLSMRPATVVLPFSQKWRSSWTSSEGLRELRLALVCFSLAVLFSAFAVLAGLTAIWLVLWESCELVR